jgi:RimJ/RimL family protein N-acetyltransferase
VAVPVFVRDRNEDVGVVTAAACRGRGLSPVCAARVIADIHTRHRTASWSTVPEHTASLRVADKLGFVKPRDNVLFVAGPPLSGMIAAAP